MIIYEETILPYYYLSDEHGMPRTEDRTAATTEG